MRTALLLCVAAFAFVASNEYDGLPRYFMPGLTHFTEDPYHPAQNKASLTTLDQPGNVPTFVMFYVKDAPRSSRMSSVFNRLYHPRKDSSDLTFGVIDIETNPELAERFGAKDGSMMLIKDGQLIAEFNPVTETDGLWGPAAVSMGQEFLKTQLAQF